MEEKIALFLYRFGKLKHEINNSPRNLTWLAKERPGLQELCFELEQAYTSIAHFLATKSAKHAFIAVPFENEWKEYQRVYGEIVCETAKPAKARALRSLMEILKEIPRVQEIIKDSGKSEAEYWQDHVEEWLSAFQSGVFNPISDDPASLMRGSRDLVAEVHDALSDSEGGALCVESEGSIIEVIANDDQDGYYQKVLGAWEFFEKTLGLDLSAINKRWRSVPDVFIQPHVAQLENAPVVELYTEAVKSYVFGGRIASMAMCRVLMEHILKRHYNIKAGDLEKIIAIAEVRYPQLKKLKMQEKRKISNDMLHNYEGGADIEDEALVGYFRTIKYLIQEIPKRR